MICAVGAVVVACVLAPVEVNAKSSFEIAKPDHSVASYAGGKKVASQAKNTFYAYVEKGESLDVAFSRAAPAEKASEEQSDSTLKITNPTGKLYASCALQVSDSKGHTCAYDALSSSHSGIWRIDYRAAKPKSKGVTANWDIAVSRKGSEVSGRVWTDSYYVHQNHDQSDTVTLFYLSQLGYQYKARYVGYQGGWSDFSVNSAGLTTKNTCTPVNHSADMSRKYSAKLTECGPYKVFFQSPSKDLPAKADLPTGGSTWLVNDITDAQLGDVTFNPANRQNGGTFEVPVTGHSGIVAIDLDIDRNGEFDNKVDRTLKTGVAAAEPQQAKATWDGIDGKGKGVDRGRVVTARARIADAGAIYFVNTDIEARSGGIEVTYLNGAKKGAHTIYWNDAFESEHEPEPMKGTDRISSTGGARSWDAGNYSWGKDRRVQEWAFHPAKVTGPLSDIKVPQRLPQPHTTTNDGALWQHVLESKYRWVAYASIATTVLSFVLLFVIAKRDRKRDRKST